VCKDNHMKRIVMVLAIVFAVFVGVGICTLVVFSQIPCCAIQQTIDLTLAKDHADGTTRIMIVTTFAGINELRAFDANGVLLATVPTVFEKDGNSYAWQTTISVDIQRVELVTDDVPQGIEVRSAVSGWRALDISTSIGFERVLMVRLDSTSGESEYDATVRISTTYDVFRQLDLYDVHNQIIASIVPDFVWDAESDEYRWELTLAPEVARIVLQPRDVLNAVIDVYSMKAGWLEDNQGIGFYRGERPLLMLLSAIEREGELIELHFEASEAVFDALQLTASDGTVLTTIPTKFVPANDVAGFGWKVTIPSNVYRIVFIPVQSELRQVLVASNVRYWQETHNGDNVGFINTPYP